MLTFFVLDNWFLLMICIDYNEENKNTEMFFCNMKNNTT